MLLMQTSICVRASGPGCVKGGPGTPTLLTSGRKEGAQVRGEGGECGFRDLCIRDAPALWAWRRL